MSRLLLLLVQVSLLLQTSYAEDNDAIESNVDLELDLKAIENQFLMFPLTSKDYENWETRGSAVFLKNRVVIVPEVMMTTGIIHAKKPLAKDFSAAWIAVVEVDIGSTAINSLGSGGMGIYYLRDVDEQSNMSGQFGYNNKFDGIAIVINPLVKAKDKTTGIMKAAL